MGCHEWWGGLLNVQLFDARVTQVQIMGTLTKKLVVVICKPSGVLPSCMSPEMTKGEAGEVGLL